MRSGSLSEVDIAHLSKRGAVGDIMGQYIDANGQIVDEALDARTVGLDPMAPRDKEIALVVAASRRKHRIVLAALRMGLVNMLVTEEKTARATLEAPCGRGTGEPHARQSR